MLLQPLYLKDMLFIALFSNIYQGEHIYDSYLVLKFIPTIKTNKCIYIPYGTKILHGIKFYGFTLVGTTVKLKSINFYYCIAKILSCFDNRKI